MDMKQLVILSGKGGTGKTSLTAAFAHLAETGSYPMSTVLADADVDAANLELLLDPQILKTEQFWGGQIAVIEPTACTGCGECERVCRFDAIHISEFENTFFDIDPIACDGCAACVYQCPEGAISMQDQVVGKWFQSMSCYSPLFHAELRPAQENSGKLVTLVKQRARLFALDEGYSLVIIDGPPGIGCPVISAASGADLVLIVAEPTMSGLHDMQRVFHTTDHFGIRSLVCVNKADLYPPAVTEIKTYCQDHSIEFIGCIPFDEIVTDSMVRGQVVTAFQPDSSASRAVQAIWERLNNLLKESV
jgi:MinD superfamily P-loop ATPase